MCRGSRLSASLLKDQRSFLHALDSPSTIRIFMEYPLTLTMFTALSVMLVDRQSTSLTSRQERRSSAPRSLRALLLSLVIYSPSCLVQKRPMLECEPSSPTILVSRAARLLQALCPKSLSPWFSCIRSIRSRSIQFVSRTLVQVAWPTAVLVAAERRTELGMSRALGLRRSHLVQLLLFEGCGYAISAALLGLLLGCGITALELQTFSLLPALGVGVAANSVPIPVLEVGVLHLSLSWQSLLSAACLGMLVTIGTVLVTAFWISRLNIVIAIRDLDEPASSPAPIGRMWRSLWKGPVDEHRKPIPETPARRVSREIEAVGGLVWGLWKRGPLCLLVGGLLFLLGSAQAVSWLQQLAVALFIAGGSLLLSWLSALWGLPGALARRLSFSVIGIGWLVLGLRASRTLLAPFQPVVLFSVPPSILELLLDMLLVVAGTVLLVMSNADLLGSLVTIMLRRVRGLAPVSRTSMVYPFTYRFRTGVTVTLLSLCVCLLLPVVTINLGAIQEV